MHIDTDDLLRVEDVARLYGVTRSAIYAQRSRGEAPGILGVKIGRTIFFRPSDLDRWFSDQLDRQLEAVMP